MSRQGANPILIECRRGAMVESLHRGAAAIVTDSGDVVTAWGDIAANFLPRSSIKPIAALSFMTSGAADRWNCNTEELVLACSSHTGEAHQTTAISAWLSRMGLSEAALQCGAHRPSAQDVLIALSRSGRKPSTVHNNNSGRHTSLLATALHLGEPIGNYRDPDHPVQRGVMETIERICGVELCNIVPAPEWCGLPNYPLPLLKLAYGMARLGTCRGLRQDDDRAARRMVGAIRARPEYLVGPGRTSTVICQATDGRVIVKGGAEGVYAGFVERAGLGLALKMDDGAARAADVAIIGLLSSSGLLTGDECKKLGSRPRPSVLDAHGAKVGEIVWVG